MSLIVKLLLFFSQKISRFGPKSEDHKAVVNNKVVWPTSFKNILTLTNKEKQLNPTPALLIRKLSRSIPSLQTTKKFLWSPTLILLFFWPPVIVVYYVAIMVIKKTW